MTDAIGRVHGDGVTIGSISVTEPEDYALTLVKREVLDLRMKLECKERDLVDMTCERDQWRRYANGLEARLDALGHRSDV